jgi:nucleoside-diphosphate-sugar epimerase
MVGNNIVGHLLGLGTWSVYGLSRTPPEHPGEMRHIACDLTDRAATLAALRDLGDVGYVFYGTWMRCATEAENCRVNRAMMRNLLDGIAPVTRLRHVALVTGLKHYLGPFEAYGQGGQTTPFREDQPRLPVQNFYYEQEDELFEAAGRHGFAWSVHRPHTLIGYAIGNAMNMAATLAAYATICRETGRPFVFPGSPQQYAAVTDVTDALLLARQVAWAATSCAGANTAFNTANGDTFRWTWLWARLADYFGIEAAEYPGRPTPLVGQMADADPIWDEIVKRHRLQPIPLSRLASWWHSDADLGREIECLTDLGRSRERGFLDCVQTLDSFTTVFDRLRWERIIP